MSYRKKNLSEVEDMAARLDLGAGSFVVEAASNDGYLLQHAVARGIRVLGVEPQQLRRLEDGLGVAVTGANFGAPGGLVSGPIVDLPEPREAGKGAGGLAGEIACTAEIAAWMV